MNENWGNDYRNLRKIEEKLAIFRGGGRENFPKNFGQINGISEKYMESSKLLSNKFGENPGYRVENSPLLPAPLLPLYLNQE
ncbi:MAG: hypothetical protein AB4080_02235 [Trichodesmium sp.]